MAKIKGKFAPLTEELGWDDRFKIDLTDLERLIYLLIIHTSHMTRHQAPIDPRYYQLQYGVRSPRHHIRAAIEQILVLYPRLRCMNGKLSLLNSPTYKSRKRLEEEVEVEVEVEGEKHAQKKVPVFRKPSLREAKDYFSSLKAESEAQNFHDHFESNGWKVAGKTAMRDWKAAARRWVRNMHKFKSKDRIEERRERLREQLKEIDDAETKLRSRNGFDQRGISEVRI